MSEYVELHCHSCFSLRDGASTLLELVLQARELGYTALALTDHNNLIGAMEFAQTAAAWNIRPITGAEITLRNGAHLTLLVETPAGYANLCRLLTQANLDNPRGDPRVDLDVLARHAAGLIALSGCRMGEVAQRAEAGEHQAAMEAADRYRSIFGRENFWIELQENLTYTDQSRNRALAHLARALDLGCVATNNVHYHLRERHRLHDVLTAIRLCTTLEEAQRFLRPNSEFFLKPPAAMQRLFADLPEAITNTARIAERCTFDLRRDRRYQFPVYQSTDGQSVDDVLRELCYQKARELYQTRFDAIEPNLQEELRLIAKGRYADLFLQLWDLLRVAHEREMPVRGRGSSVSSLVCYLLGLSGIDPIKYNLYIGRFLNEARLEENVPDIDLDLGRHARDEMFRLIFARYTTAHAAQVCAVIEYRYPSAIRDIGKAFGFSPAEIDAIAKQLHSRYATSLSEELAAMPQFRDRLHTPIWQEFVRLVDELHGFPRHLSQHSGGIVLSTTRIDEQVPVERPAMEGRFICQWDKDSVADAGMIKLDLLSYPSLDQLNRALRYIMERHGRRIAPKDIPFDDADVYAMIRRGDVIGVVQIQSRAQMQILLQIPVETIHDLIIQVALIRPGPIQGGAVHPYVARKLKREKVSYDHDCLRTVLAETKGVLIFQEQVMQTATAIAGFSAAQAEMLRRAMSRKRSREAMEALREEFLTGAAHQGISASIATAVYEKILAFAQFGFPKSHAVALAETAYTIAWLKCHYRIEFYAALLNEQPFGFYSVEVICNDARRHGIRILGVDVNASQRECMIEDNDAIRLGYMFVKELGEAALQRLDEEAVNGAYRSLWDFWRRTRLRQEAIESLIQIGAFFFTGLHERELLWQLGTFYQPLQSQQPLPLPLDDERVELREMSRTERIVADLEVLSIAVRGRSIELIADRLHEGITPSPLLERLEAGQHVTVAGLVAVRQAPGTAKGFIFHTLEDGYGFINIISNPATRRRYRALIEHAPALIVHGHIERRERAVNVIASHFEALAVATVAGRQTHSFH
jgi:error-prone DNA polymerase